MISEITMRELIIIVLCFVLYVVAVEVYEAKVSIARQGKLVEQEQSFNYIPPDSLTVSDSGVTIITGLESD